MPYEKARAQMNRGQARPTLFSVSIPRAENNSFFEANDYLNFFCKSAAVPSIAHETIGANGQERVGVVRQQPVSVVYGKPFQITVIERADFLVYNQLKQWFDRTNPGTNQQAIVSHRMNYYDNIVCDIKLMKLEYSPDASSYDVLAGKQVQGDVTPDGFVKPLVVKFKNAYPTTIGDINLSTDSRDTALEYQVSFNYETYETTDGEDDNDD